MISAQLPATAAQGHAATFERAPDAPGRARLRATAARKADSAVYAVLSPRALYTMESFEVSLDGRRAHMHVLDDGIRIEADGSIYAETDSLLSVRLYGRERIVLVWDEDGLRRRTATVRVHSAPAASVYSLLSSSSPSSV